MAIPLCSISTGELGRSLDATRPSNGAADGIRLSWTRYARLRTSGRRPSLLGRASSPYKAWPHSQRRYACQTCSSK